MNVHGIVQYLTFEKLLQGLAAVVAVRSLLPRMGGLGLVAAGIVVGGALGLMFAPASGRKFRSQIGKRVHDTIEEIEQYARRAHDGTGQAVRGHA